MLSCPDDMCPDSVILYPAQQFTLPPVMLLSAALLSPCFAILLHVDVIVGLEGMDGLVGKLNSVKQSVITSIKCASRECT